MRFRLRSAAPKVTSDLYGGYVPKSVVEKGAGALGTTRGTRASRLRWRGRCGGCGERLERGSRDCPHSGVLNARARPDLTFALVAVLAVCLAVALYIGVGWIIMLVAYG